MISKTREFLPDTYPAFPDGLPSIDLETVSLSQLEAGNTQEQERLFEICKTQGFFYLDFTNSSFATLPSDAEQVVSISEDIFKLPTEEKKIYAPDFITNQLWGYKAPGIGIVDSKGTKTTNEFFNLSKDELLANPSKRLYALPTQITTNTTFLTTYMETAHSLGLTILSILATKLHLPPDTFTHLHNFTSKSGDHIRMTRGPPRLSATEPEIQTAGHTDFGSITILFNWLGGLQIWGDSSPVTSKSKAHANARSFTNVVDPESHTGEKWLWVQPRPGCAVVNLGDCAVKWTNGLFCSGRHRVVPAPGGQGRLPRYSLVYFVRPEDDAVLRCLGGDVIPQVEGEGEGGGVTAKEWIAEQVRTMFGKGVSNKT